MASEAPRSSYFATRDMLAGYFDGTAQKAWIDLTSDAKVSRIRATVRAGRDRMRATLAGWLGEDLRRRTVLDAGCGTGALSVALACRGALVTGADIAAGLVAIGRQRAPAFLGHGAIDWRVGDMLSAELGRFDHIVAMDSLIHYEEDDLVHALSGLAARCERSLLFTFAPRTPLLAAMHKAGKLFPRSDRSPAIVPIAETSLRAALGSFGGWRIGRSQRVAQGFYTSHALELVRCG